MLIDVAEFLDKTYFATPRIQICNFEVADSKLPEIYKFAENNFKSEWAMRDTMHLTTCLYLHDPQDIMMLRLRFSEYAANTYNNGTRMY